MCQKRTRADSVKILLFQAVLSSIQNVYLKKKAFLIATFKTSALCTIQKNIFFSHPIFVSLETVYNFSFFLCFRSTLFQLHVA